MKITIGTYVVIAFGLFMAFIITLVVKTYNYKVDLVSDDYYGQELNYQTKINKISNAFVYGQSVDCIVNDKDVIISFGGSDNMKNIKGEIEFYRPSDSSKDIKIAIDLENDGKQMLSKKKFMEGLYTMKVDWIVNGVNYYVEKDIYIQ